MERIVGENGAPVNSDERSALFIKYVEAYDSDDPCCISAEHAVGLYAKINQALRDDEEMAIKRYAGYIFELRNIFKSDNNIACQPFVGTVHWGSTVAATPSYLADMHPDKEFVWPHFVSTSLSGNAEAFAGNIRFDIACNMHLKPGNHTQ
eukprot:3096890-Amphidinium_carterae.1